jgi:heme-degrading monooxygenase HmoA
VICRMWHGWTRAADADGYDHYLQDELFPHLERELSPRGYRGYHLLRLAREEEVEFVTLVWFESLEAVKSFAGDSYETPVISEKARPLLTRYDRRCEHWELSGTHLAAAGMSGE